MPLKGVITSGRDTLIVLVKRQSEHILSLIKFKLILARLIRTNNFSQALIHINDYDLQDFVGFRDYLKEESNVENVKLVPFNRKRNDQSKALLVTFKGYIMSICVCLGGHQVSGYIRIWPDECNVTPACNMGLPKFNYIH